MISYRLSQAQYVHMSSGAVVYRLNQNGDPEFVVLVRNPNTARNPTSQPTYHLPKGTLEPGETLEQNAKREIAEEAGVEVELQGYLGASVLPLRREKQPPLRDRDGNEITINYFIAKYLDETAEGMDHEHDAVLWLRAEQAIGKLAGYWKHEDEFIRRASQWLQTHDQSE